MVLGDLAGRYHVQGSFANSILILLHLIKSIFWIQAKGDRASSRTDVYDAGRRYRLRQQWCESFHSGVWSSGVCAECINELMEHVFVVAIGDTSVVDQGIKPGSSSALDQAR
jgi:hypothetical protein